MNPSISPSLLQEVKALSIQQQRQLRDLLDSLLSLTNSNDETESENSLAQELLVEGFLDHVPPPMRDFSTYRNRKQIEVIGQPTSQILIAERR